MNTSKSRSENILWYWRPFSFGFFLGFVVELFRFYFVSCITHNFYTQMYSHVSDPKWLNELWKLEGQIMRLNLAGNMVNEGIEVAFRSAVVTAFIAFAINQVKGEWAEHFDDALTLIFGKTHYSIIGFFTADLARVCLKTYAGLFFCILAVVLVFSLFGGELLY